MRTKNKRAKKPSTQRVAVTFDAETTNRIDNLRKRLADPWLELSRQDLVRWMVSLALASGVDAMRLLKERNVNLKIRKGKPS